MRIINRREASGYTCEHATQLGFGAVPRGRELAEKPMAAGIAWCADCGALLISGEVAALSLAGILRKVGGDPVGCTLGIDGSIALVARRDGKVVDDGEQGNEPGKVVH